MKEGRGGRVVKERRGAKKKGSERIDRRKTDERGR